MKALLFAVIFLLICVPSAAEPELKGSPDDLKGILYPREHIVTIRGAADITAYADKAIVSLVVTTQNKLLSEAIANNDARRNSIGKALIAAGIAPEAIKNSKFSSSPQYGWLAKRPSSYEVVNRIAITVTKEAQLREVARLVDELNGVGFSATTFEHSKKDELNAQVKKRAIKKILKQKATYEKSFGIQLTPRGIREAAQQQTATRGAQMLEEVIVTGVRQGKGAQAQPSRQSKLPQTPSFDEIKYTAEIAVDFKIQSMPQ